MIYFAIAYLIGAIGCEVFFRLIDGEPDWDDHSDVAPIISWVPILNTLFALFLCYLVIRSFFDPSDDTTKI